MTRAPKQLTEQEVLERRGYLVVAYIYPPPPVGTVLQSVSKHFFGTEKLDGPLCITAITDEADFRAQSKMAKWDLPDPLYRHFCRVVAE